VGESKPARLAPGRRCLKCKKVGKKALNPRGFHDECWRKIETEVLGWQERDHLAQWLHSRADANGEPYRDSALTASAAERRQVMRLVRLARKLHIDWTKPPANIVFGERRERWIVEKYGAAPSQRGRAGRKTA
jgi:hypothetical protein